METKTFSPLYVARLSVADLYSLNKSTIEIVRPMKENIGEIPNAALLGLETSNAEMGACLNKPGKSALSDALAEKDKDRDNRLAEIKRNISTAQAGSDPAKKMAAGELKLVFEPYWNTDKKAMNTETALIAELIGKINASGTLKQQAEAIGITTLLEGLKITNEEFDSLYKSRNKQMAEQDSPSASSLRPAVAKSYEQFCTAMEQAVNFVPSQVLLTLFAQMDELRIKYARLISKSGNGGNNTPGEPQEE
ncbi:MAG: hypothetical protein A2W90_06175 [Bacteroidetes bacterium GWF2_42_66]|nr:MAG: hypothetical protein A2W92_17690 [Bacteroidetes bacterium GWA2_42_15]OFX97056.1 MAG: hypothetical protein A2W89_04000 [Bacteroidetes bacterium GWE2_42_39]OFY46140.1 MAG: hypothetical protein A2W90_06175 [Bacteroidetes bacterium GWF2_42_66]HBL75647.1 hypothetical protein [Prolixibacteraceae bacterium]HCU61374.1 hypothetical protein [Prolixibacteraceae bacterium]